MKMNFLLAVLVKLFLKASRGGEDNWVPLPLLSEEVYYIIRKSI